jgi:SAM-dependent methyltransferase
VTELDEKLRSVGAMWGGADYERVASLFASIHDRLVDALEPRAGDDWLDLATGTGEVALRAARRGATVVGVDLSEPLLAQARAKAEAEGLDVAWELADVQRLRYEDASFDILSSCFGVIFAPNREAVARELARLSRPGGRLGLTTWPPDEELERLFEPFVDDPAPSEPPVWGDPKAVRGLLGDAFELSFEQGEWVVEFESAAAVWELYASSAPPMKALIDSLEPERREKLREAFVDVHERYGMPGGGVRVPREYLLVLGRRR